MTQTTPAEHACLIRHAAGKKSVVEIGVFEGVTTRVLREAMADDGVLYAIDPFRRGRLGVSLHRLIARGEVAQSHNGNVEWIRATGDAAVNDERVADVSVDFIFVDGDHTWEAVEADWNAWRPKMASGGIMAFHDSREIPGEPSQRFMEQVISTDPEFTVIDTEFRVTVLKKTS